MLNFHTYLVFNGNAKEAMKFYADAMNAELYLMTFGEAEVPCGDAEKHLIMHASVTKGNLKLMASDSNPQMGKVTMGDNFSISIATESIAETDALFAALSKNGKIVMAPQETFWATKFAMFTDQFGVNWMLNLEKKH